VTVPSCGEAIVTCPWFFGPILLEDGEFNGSKLARSCHSTYFGIKTAIAAESIVSQPSLPKLGNRLDAVVRDRGAESQPLLRADVGLSQKRGCSHVKGLMPTV
jgi:hypothetical protein